MNKKSILLIEDDELDVISFERAIQKLNFELELITAYNGLEALKILQNPSNHMPDIIILDLNMPRMNGIEFLKEIRKNEIFDPIQVFVMTTSNDDYEKNVAEMYNISGYIIKPLNFDNNDKRSVSMDYFMHFHILKILSQ